MLGATQIYHGNSETRSRRGGAGEVSKWLSIFGQKYKSEIKGARLIAYNSGAQACPHSSVAPQVGGPRGLPAVD